ncbi:hypothetical protein SeLEV6574_g05492 [Synchytrium endobioticum]|uniref:Uncharacterized protein n=1 Tax=Synchytrium endobioticum TaxID=286115 RepID=A0A507CTZ8_9FUNG|nr:hypothetical protein SeLEV6574_g05492 [Synchytrium endobioticum]
MSATFHMHTNVITDEFYPGRDGIVDRATNQVDSFSISKVTSADLLLLVPSILSYHSCRHRITHQYLTRTHPSSSQVGRGNNPFGKCRPWGKRLFICSILR